MADPLTSFEIPVEFVGPLRFRDPEAEERFAEEERNMADSLIHIEVPLTARGRDELLRIVDSQHAELGRLKRAYAEACEHRDVVQHRCSCLLTELLELRELAPFAKHLQRARALHQEGSRTEDLLSEVAEYLHELHAPTSERAKLEAFDVAVVAFRIAIGEDGRNAP